MKPYYQHAGITIYHGDNRELLPELACDVIFADPPYGVGLEAKRAKQRGGGVSIREGTYEVRHGEFWFYDTPEYVSVVVVPIIEQCRSKANAVALTPGTRNMWMYHPPDDMGCFYSGAGTGMGKWGFTCCHPILYYGNDPYLANSMGSRPNSCGQTYPNDANEVAHPCAKPIRMMMWLVNRVTLEGGTIIDPFTGSGAILLAAKELRRKAIGIEIEEKYCEIAAKRLSQEVFDFGS
jgi:DNA modification methylase